MDDGLKKASARLIIGIVNNFFNIAVHNLTTTKLPNYVWWKPADCPLKKCGKSHLINSQLVWGLGKASWMCGYCGEWEFLEFEDDNI